MTDAQNQSMEPPTRDQVTKAALLFSVERSCCSSGTLRQQKPLSARECMLLTGLDRETASNVSYQQRVRRFHKKFLLENVIANVRFRHDITTPAYAEFPDDALVKSALVYRLVVGIVPDGNSGGGWSCADCMVHAGVIAAVAYNADMQAIVQVFAEQFADDAEMLQSVYFDIRDGRVAYFSSRRRTYSSNGTRLLQSQTSPGVSENVTELDRLMRRLGIE